MTDDIPLHERDEWIPPECKVERLLQMPMLAMMAAEIRQSRNPDGTTSEHSAPTFGSRPAARLDIIDLAEGPTTPAELQTLILWCSRPIWEALDADTRRAHPQPIGTVTWATECTWLADVWGDSRAWLDEVDEDMVDMTLDDCYRALTRAVGLRPPAPWPCLTEGCQGTLTVQDDGWLMCEYGHVHQGLAKWRFHQPMQLPDLAQEFDVKEPTLWQWHLRGKLPYASDQKPYTAWPWDVIRCKFPDLSLLIEDQKAS